MNFKTIDCYGIKMKVIPIENYQMEDQQLKKQEIIDFIINFERQFGIEKLKRMLITNLDITLKNHLIDNFKYQEIYDGINKIRNIDDVLKFY